MDPSFIQLLTDTGPAAVITGLFLMYLTRKQKLDNQIYDQFNKTINTHLKETNNVLKDISKTNTIVAEKLQSVHDKVGEASQNAERRYVNISKSIKNLKK